MAAAVEAQWSEGLEGLIITRYGHGVPCQSIEIVEAAHPVPDAAGQQAATRIASMVEGLTSDDFVLCLISGGGSALLAAPAPGLTLADKQELNRQLLSSGAPIGEMNCVRKHLSALKGGRLAARAHPARVLSLVISDVPGDDPSTVASGPTVADPTTVADARAVIARYGLKLPAHIEVFLATPEAETPKPGDPRLARAETRIIAAPALSHRRRGACCRSGRLSRHRSRRPGGRRSARGGPCSRRAGAQDERTGRRPLGRRDDRHPQGQRAGRPQQRICACPCHRARWRSRHIGHCLRHRRHRRLGG